MPRGGARQGAGKPSSWSSGCSYDDTKLVRVPKAIAEQVIEIAHDIDAGIEYPKKVKELEEKIAQLQKQTTNDELLEKAKQLLFDEQLCRKNDRSAVRKVLSALLKVDVSFFK